MELYCARSILVLGIGSPFGDDQLGWAVAQRLQQRTRLQSYMPDRLQIESYDRPGLHLIESMRHAKTVFLIDAVKSNTTIGTLHCFKKEAIGNLDCTLSTHGLGLAAAIKIAEALNELPENITLYGIEIGDSQNQLTRSDTLLQATEALSLQIENDIVSLLGVEQGTVR